MRSGRSALLLLWLIPAAAVADPEWQLLHVNGASMEPAIHGGDLLCLHRSVPEFNIDDLVAIRLGRGTPPLLKRVVAVAGDRIEIREGRLIRNGSVVASQPRHKRISVLKLQLSRYGNIVPDGNLIALGDNESQSFDSSAFGLVAIPQLLGTITPDLRDCTLSGRGNL